MNTEKKTNPQPSDGFPEKAQEISSIPHCPNPKCPNFHDPPPNQDWHKPHGTYETKAFGTVSRFLCTTCKKTFSTQTFKLDYYVKKPVDYTKLLHCLVTSSGQRNIWRFENMRVELIQNRYERLARVFLAIMSQTRNLMPPTEDFVLDGFESFSNSQFYPNNINILVGKKSEFIYGIGLSILRRKGRMTPFQKIMRELLERYERANPKDTEISVTSLLADICRIQRQKKTHEINLFTDEHKAYQRAVKKLNKIWTIKHFTTSSRAVRNRLNDLFAVNYCDRQFRKDLANHVRETVQFARCPAAMMIRMTLYQGYHNWIIPRRVRAMVEHNMSTRPEYMGINKKELWKVISEKWGLRPFYRKLELWEQEEKTWKMEWRNPGVLMNRYLPKYIFK